MIKLAVLDVDGTITSRDRRISTASVEALRKAQDSGLITSLVSGNVLPVMYGLKVFVGINGPVFGENGGIMLQGDETKAFFSKEAPGRFVTEMSVTTSVRPILTNRWRETSMSFVMDQADVEKVREAAGKKDIEVVDSGYSWHALNPGQNKGFAVDVLAGIYGLDFSEILVCGDSDNDLSMFEKPVVRATVDNGTESLKSKSDYVSDLGFGDGVVDILKHFSLI